MDVSFALFADIRFFENPECFLLLGGQIQFATTV